MQGVLAIWNDCAAEHLETYEDWYQNEHLPERLAVPGFLLGRRYEAIAARRQFLTIYHTVHPDVFQSRAYLERLDTPTPLTRRMMAVAFRNMSRTTCRCVSSNGIGYGSIAVTIAVSQQDDVGTLRHLIPSKADFPHLLRSELWESTRAMNSALSTEESIRGVDQKIGACLAIEFLDEPSASEYFESISAQDSELDAGLYRLRCFLTGGERP